MGVLQSSGVGSILLYIGGQPITCPHYEKPCCKCNDRKYTRNKNCFQEHLFRHFHRGEHTGFLENVKIMLIDETDGRNPKKREDYWRRIIKTYAPFLLNVNPFRLNVNFYKKTLIPPSMIFQKFQPPINKGGSHYIFISVASTSIAPTP